MLYIDGIIVLWQSVKTCECHNSISSTFRHQMNHIELRMKRKERLSVSEAYELKFQFYLFLSSVAYFTVSQEFSVLMVSFHLQRHMGNFLIQVYGPCVRMFEQHPIYCAFVKFIFCLDSICLSARSFIMGVVFSKSRSDCRQVR
jgi:hypothetical protein